MKYNFRITILDRYIIKKFIGSYLMALLLIIVIVIIFDISEKIDDFEKNSAPLMAIIFDYYLNFIPYFISMFSPLFVFITVIFFTSKLAANTEITAMLAGGISFKRLMYPYMLSATFIFILGLALSLFIIPTANKDRLAFEEKYIKKRDVNIGNNTHYQIDPGTFLYSESFSSYNNTIYMFTLESIEKHNIKSKLFAERAQWDSTKLCWTLYDYELRTYGTQGESIKKGNTLDTAIAVTISDFYRKTNEVERYNVKMLNEMIEVQKMRGDATIKYSLIEKNIRYSMPFSAFILTIMGVSLSSKKRRGGIGMNIGIGLALSFSYILFMRFSEMFVHTDTLPPFIAIWLPNIIYSFIALFLYRIAPK